MASSERKITILIFETVLTTSMLSGKIIINQQLTHAHTESESGNNHVQGVVLEHASSP
jgi:hypothetical protein